MQEKSYYRDTIDAIRTAPYGLATFALGVSMEIAAVSHGPVHPLQVVIAVWGLHCIVKGPKKMIRQFQVRRDLEEILEQSGMQESVFIRTTKMWCSRQTARVVCERAGYLAQYEQLCQQNTENMWHKKIPHW